MIISNLKPAVNRQPMFPRGGPEELAKVHNVHYNSYMTAPHIKIINEIPQGGRIQLDQRSNMFFENLYILTRVGSGA